MQGVYAEANKTRSLQEKKKGMKAKTIISEKSLCNSIVEFLNYQGHFVWRTNSGMMRGSYTDKKGVTRSRMVLMARKGTSDILGMTRDGRFVAIEVKKPETRKRVTIYQNLFIEDVRLHGGIAGVATSPEEALIIIKSYGNQIKEL